MFTTSFIKYKSILSRSKPYEKFKQLDMDV